MSGARIHPPSPFKLRELRRRGIVPRSALLTFAGVYSAIGLTFYALAPRAAQWMRDSLAAAVRAPQQADAGALLGHGTSALAGQGALFVALWLVAVLVAVAVSIAQFGIAGGRFGARERNSTDMDGMRARWATLVSSTARRVGTLVAALGVTAFAMLSATNQARHILGDPFALVQALGVLCLGFGGVLLVLGLIDFAYVRHSYFQSHRMTQAERDEELRNLRGQGQTIRRSV